MTPSRFIQCLEALHWSTDQVAEILNCDEGLVEAWALGFEEVPPKAAAWLETLAKIHEGMEGERPDLRRRKAKRPTEH